MLDEIIVIAKAVMGNGGSIEPSVAAYFRYCATFFVRYFALTGAVYWFFYVGFRNRWLRHKIQQKFPGRAQLAHEVGWASVTAACQGISALVIYQLIRDGNACLYFDVAERGVPYLVLSSILCVVGYDAWTYFQHRWLHRPWVFKHIHWVHHHSSNPTSLSAFAQHPVETLLGNLFFVLVVAFVPIHPTALLLANLYMILFGVYAHVGFELYPSGFLRHPLLQWFNTATHHNMHHRNVGCNYSAWFNWWDRIFGTNHPAYQATFEATQVRIAEGRSAGVRVGAKPGARRDVPGALLDA